MIYDDFINKFRFPFDTFSSPVKWIDDEGFGVVQDFDDKHASLYKIGIYEQNLGSTDPLKRLWISVTYGEKVQSGIRFETERGLYDPVDLDFPDEYFYNINTGKFYHYQEEIDPQAILLSIKKKHLLPTMKIKGVLLRAKLYFWRKFLPSLIEFFDKMFIVLLWLVSGETIKGSISERWINDWLSDSDGEEKSNESIQKDRISRANELNKGVNVKKSKTINFFGNDVERWPIVFYCSLHLIIYFLLFSLSIKDPLVISKLIHNSFLLLCYIIVSLTLVESFIPYTLRLLLKETQKVFKWVAFKAIKV